MREKVILKKDKQCWFCGNTQNLHLHHIFHGSANRKISDKYALCVWVCAYHHNLGQKCVHNNKEMDLILKTKGQEYFENTYGSREDFIKIFGRNYL
jgi:hypothetical protein